MIGRPFLRAAIAVAGLAFGVLAGAASGAPPAIMKDRFELTADLEARVAAHQDLVTNAGRSPDDFCKLAADTVRILDPVALELSRFGGSEHNNVSFEAIQRAYKRTERLVPGLSLVATEEFTQTGIDYRSLIKTAPPDARPLLRAMSRFEGGAD